LLVTIHDWIKKAGLEDSLWISLLGCSLTRDLAKPRYPEDAGPSCPLKKRSQFGHGFVTVEYVQFDCNIEQMHLYFMENATGG
jgi:hypothetical protein